MTTRAGAPVLTQRQLNRALLARQLLLDRAPVSPESAIEHLLGLQAALPQSRYQSLTQRLPMLRAVKDANELALNEIGRIQLRTTVPLLCDPYSKNRTTGSFILIDEATGVTVGAGMINSGS